jgi:CAAX prenyl protease-like protein
VSDGLPRILPFATYLLFLGLTAGIGWTLSLAPSLVSWTSWAGLWLYPIKIVAVLGMLLYFWPAYHELRDTKIGNLGEIVIAAGVGASIYFLWVRMAWPWAMLGQPTGYEPFQAGYGQGTVLAAMKLFGAAIVVPIMEELFWRSFLLRYLISPRFASVPLGTFSLSSFLISIVLFGLEHHLWAAGMVAGTAYTVLLYWKGRLWLPIIAHGVTNLMLGVHVLLTHEWIWW